MKHLYVGTYTTGTASQGVYHFAFCTQTGALTLLDTAPCEDPSFLAVRGDRLYAGSERMAHGGVTAFAIHAQSGALSDPQRLEVPGAALCHVCLWPDGRHLSAANYMSGSLATCALDERGAPKQVTQLVQHTGVGHDSAGRQEGPHVHSTLIDPQGRLLAADLGLDRLVRYRAHANGTLTLDDTARFVAPPGAGPRHFAFSADGKWLYVVAEMGNALLVYDYAAAGDVTPRQVLPLLPQGYCGGGLAAHIVREGSTLYVSNRGHDSLTVFDVQPNGTVQLRGHASAHGKGPRHFCVDGSYVVLANQQSDSVVVCRRDPLTGDVGAKVAQAHVPQAVCVVVR